MRLKKFLLFCLTCLFCLGLYANINRQEINFNNDWRFTLTDSISYSLPYRDFTHWRPVNLPHDWSVELPFDSIHGDGATGYLLGGIGWYAKEFKTPINKYQQECYILFDGVYNNATFYLNGRCLAFHPYGYSPIYYQLDDYLKPQGQVNQLVIRVDHSRYVDSRWYTGSGIYRDVKMVLTDKMHIPIWGTFVTTPEVTKQHARVQMTVSLDNDYGQIQRGTLRTTYYDMNHQQVAQVDSSFLIQPKSKMILNQKVDLFNPNLWNVDAPYLYEAVTEIIEDGKVIDTKSTAFGIRTIRFDAHKGFFLNGKNMKIKGVCLHHDAGIIGASFIKDVWEMRLRKLKDCGVNAIRTSHNPPADEFLTLCDQLGFLVQLEFFDEWDYPKDKRLNTNQSHNDVASQGYDVYFQKWAQRDLENTMLSARNHPCIFQWSIGNEIEWTYPGNKEATGFFGADATGNYFWTQPPYTPAEIREKWQSLPKTTYDIGRTAHRLSSWVKALDTTRPVVANCILPSVSFETGYIDALDVAGFSYRRVMYDYAHKHYPNKPVMGTENVAQYHEWKAVMDRDFVPGMFIWTGFDYMGERGGPYNHWPAKSTASGLIDLAGFKKPSFYMMKSLWGSTPMIAIYSQTADKSVYKKVNDHFVDIDKRKPWNHRLWVWNDLNQGWNYRKGAKVIVEIYSNCEEITLYQNGKSLGSKKLSDFVDHIYKWEVDYQPGQLIAKGKHHGEIVQSKVVTAGKPAKIRLTSNRVTASANGTDVIAVRAQLLDKNDQAIYDTNRRITFHCKGKYRLLGVDNGSVTSVESFQNNSTMTNEGHCLFMVQTTKLPSELNISASSDGLEMTDLTINIK